MNARMKTLAGVAAILLAAGGAVAEVNIETVPVGNTGNLDDTYGDGYGAVDYEYNIATYEVTAGQYTEFLNAVGGVDTYVLYITWMWTLTNGCKIERYAGSGTPVDPYQYRVASDWQDRPVNYVTWGSAARFANWLHNGQPCGAQDLTTTEDGAYYLNGALMDVDLQAVSREDDWQWAIPTEDEWYKSAYHRNDGDTGNYFGCPTSSDSAPGYVDQYGNLVTTGDPFTEGGTDPGNYATYTGDLGPGGIGSPYYRTEVGEWENSANPYGTFDQGGNVREWTETIVDGWGRCLRGGSYGNTGPWLRAWHRTHITPMGAGSGLGFRLCQVPGPSCVVILALGGVGMLGRRPFDRTRGKRSVRR